MDPRGRGLRRAALRPFDCALTAREARRASRLGACLRCACFVGVEEERRNRGRATRLVDRHEGEPRIDARPAPTGARIFTFHVDRDLERRAERRSDAAREAHHLADLDRLLELQIVDEGRHGRLPGVTRRADGAAEVDPGHDLTAEDRAERVRVLRQHVLRHLGDGRRRGARRERGRTSFAGGHARGAYTRTLDGAERDL